MSGSKRIAKFAASTKAQDRYLLPFFVLPLPLRLPLESFSLPTHRQYEAKFPTCANLLMSPVSSMIVSARIFPIPLTNSRPDPKASPFEQPERSYALAFAVRYFFYSSSVIRLILGQTSPPLVFIRSIYARFSHCLIALS